MKIFGNCQKCGKKIDISDFDLKEDTFCDDCKQGVDMNDKNNATVRFCFIIVCSLIYLMYLTYQIFYLIKH